MAWAVTNSQNATAAISGGAFSLALTFNVNTGSTLIVVVNNVQGVVSSVTLSAGSATFTKAVAVTNGSISLSTEIWAANVTTGATTPTITVNTSSTGTGDMVVYQASGGATTLTTDGTNSNAATSGSASLTTNSITTTTAGDLVIKGFSCNGSPTGAAQSGWTEINPDASGNIAGYIVQTSAGAITGTDAFSSASTYTGAIAAFKAGSGPTTINATWSTNPKAILTLGASGGTTPPVATLVQHVATSMDANCLASNSSPLNYAKSPATTLTVNLPNLTLANNTLILAIQWSGTGGTIASVKDSAGNNFTTGPSFTQAGGNTCHGQIFYLIGCVSGLTGAVVTFGTTGSLYQPQGILSEWYNITGLDTGINSSSATSLSPGALTTTAPGLIYYYGVDISDNTQSGGYAAGFKGSTITAGSGLTLLSADLMWGYLDQYQTYGAATTITPTATTSGAATWGSIAMAFKSGTQGTAPSASAMRIVRVYGVCLSGPATSTVGSGHVISSVYFPCQGNSLAILYNANAAGFTSITDSNSNSWTCLTANLVSNNVAQVSYAQNATSGSNLKLTLNFGGADLGPFALFLDMVNGSTTALFDKLQNSNGNQAVNGNLTTTTITPTHANGVVVEVATVTWNTLSSPLSAGMIFDAPVESIDDNNIGTNGTGAGPISQDNGYAHFYPTTTAALTFQYGQTNFASAGAGIAGAASWDAQAVSFNGGGAATVNAAITFNPKATLTIGSATTHQATIIFSPKITLTLRASGGTPTVISGALPYSMWGGGIV